MERSDNYIHLRGVLARLPQFSHENHGKRFYSFPLEVERLSGTVDLLPVLLPEQVLLKMDLSGGDMLEITGQIRTYNNRGEGDKKLIISAFAQSIAACEGEPVNEVVLTGTLCKEPVYRQTPLGRQICDGMLAVNRPYHRADYIPCIFWGALASQVSRCGVGTELELSGRLQSRFYTKMLPQGSKAMTAYEVSVNDAEIFGNPET